MRDPSPAETAAATKALAHEIIKEINSLASGDPYARFVAHLEMSCDELL
jgi:hypothetical protein